MPRILVIANHEGPYGAPMAALRLAKGLKCRGHSVAVCFLYKRQTVSNSYYPFETLFPKNPNSIFQYALVLANILRRVRSIQPDIVVTFMPLAGIFGNVAATVARVPKRIVSHRAPVGNYAPMIRWLDTAMAFLGCYTDVVAVSTAVRESVRHYPKRLLKRTSVVYNGLLAWEPSKLTKAEARTRLGLLENEFVLVAVGRLERQKNLSFLLPVVAQLPFCTLIIAGEGSLRDELEQTAKALGVDTRVRFLGTVPHDSVADVLKAADFFVQPSLYEGQSNSLLEALYSELPVLSSDVPEQIEALTGPDGRIAGAILPLTDRDAWVRAIERFRDSPEALENARGVCRLLAGLFSFDRMISGFESALAM